MFYVWLALHDLACTAAIVAMVLTDHPWWAIPFLVSLFSTTVRDSQTKKELPDTAGVVL